MCSLFRSAKRKAGSFEELWFCRCAWKLLCLDGVGGALIGGVVVVVVVVVVIVIAELVAVAVVFGDKREDADGSVVAITLRLPLTKRGEGLEAATASPESIFVPISPY